MALAVGNSIRRHGIAEQVDTDSPTLTRDCNCRQPDVIAFLQSLPPVADAFSVLTLATRLIGIYSSIRISCCTAMSMIC